MIIKSKIRCAWTALNEPLYVAYHDEEWGRPVHDDQKLFEFLILEGAQAGLSWLTVLKRREGYRKAFDQFEPQKVAKYTPENIEQLMNNPEIIRNRLKIHSTILNAQKFLDIQDELGSFNTYVWAFVGGKPKKNRWKSIREIPSTSEESILLSKDLAKRGFKFIGPTIMYAFMQAVGMVNDHTTDCWCYKK